MCPKEWSPPNYVLVVALFPLARYMCTRNSPFQSIQDDGRQGILAKMFISWRWNRHQRKIICSNKKEPSIKVGDLESKASGYHFHIPVTFTWVGKIFKQATPISSQPAFTLEFQVQCFQRSLTCSQPQIIGTTYNSFLPLLIGNKPIERNSVFVPLPPLSLCSPSLNGVQV